MKTLVITNRLPDFHRMFPGKCFVEECHSFNEAEKAIQNHKPDVLFFDHNLSENGNEGFEIANKFKAAPIKMYLIDDPGKTMKINEKERLRKKYRRMCIKSITTLGGEMERIINWHEELRNI